METRLADSRVLVTGGTGFIGSHLVDELLRAGAEPIVVDNNSRGTPENLTDIGAVEYLEGDLTDPDVADNCTRMADYCFHLAAIVGDVAFMSSNPHKIYENLVIDYNLFEACRQNDVEKTVYASSSCVYPVDLQDEAYVELNESDAYAHGANPDSDYGWTKVVGEQMAMSLANDFDLPISIARPFNPYGPRESFAPEDSHVIPAFIRRAVNEEDPFVVWGSGEQVRTFTYVEDLARGLTSVMEEVDGGETINLSRSGGVKISDLAETVLDITGHDATIQFDESKPEGVKVRTPDTSKAAAKLDWTPEVSLRDGIERTYEWYTAQ